MSSLMNDVLVFQQTTSFASNDFAIMDDQGVQVGHVETGGSALGRMFVGSRELTVFEGPERPVLKVKDTYSFGRDRMEILDASGGHLASLLQRRAMFKTRIRLDLQGEELELTGDVWGFEFQVSGQGGEIAWVSREWAGLGNVFFGKSTYALRLTEHLNTHQRHAIIGAVLALDLIRAKQKRRTRNASRG